LLNTLQEVASRPVPLPQVLTGLGVLHDRIAEREKELAARLSLIMFHHEEAQKRAALIHDQEARLREQTEQYDEQIKQMQNQDEQLLEKQQVIQTQHAELLRRTQYERLVAHAGPLPLVSVVIALGNARGDLKRCIRAWTREQTLPRDRFE